MKATLQRLFLNPSLFCSVTGSVSVLQASGSEIPVVIQNMIRMRIPSRGMLPAGELPLPGGEQTGQHFPNLPPSPRAPPFFFFFSLQACGHCGWKGEEQNRRQTCYSLKSSDSHTSWAGSCCSQVLWSALLCTLLAFLGALEHADL